MSIVSVQADTVEMVVGVHNKFYRAFTLGPYYVFQYGKRHTDGTFVVANDGSEAAARRTAADQLDSKRAKGYEDATTPRTHFDVDLDEFKTQLSSGGNKGAGLWLVQQMARNTRLNTGRPSGITSGGRPAVVAPAKPKPTNDRLGDLTEATLKALSTAAVDPTAGIREYAVLQAKLTELDRELDAAHTYVTTLGQMVGVEIPDDEAEMADAE